MNILLFTAGIFIFAWFIHDTGLKQMIGFSALLLPCVAFYRHMLSERSIWDTFHIAGSKFFPGSLMAGLILGISAGMYYRHQTGMTPFPASITWFAPIAVAIGVAEEFVFRGAMFSMMRKWPAYLTIPITALLHASYKTLLFLQPHIEHPVDTWFLFYTTFFAGLVLGFIRYTGKSILPVMASHGSWDAIVYGDNASAPWWVW